LIRLSVAAEVTYPTILKLLDPCVGAVDGLNPSPIAQPESAMARARVREKDRISRGIIGGF